MHTKTLVGVSVMVLLGVLGLFAFCARFMSVSPSEVVGEIKDNVPTEQTPIVSSTTTEAETETEAPVAEVVSETKNERRALPESEEKVVVKSERFAGVLEEVNVGCFADGECYVVVDGKYITTLIGWTSATVGSIKGVEGFGDLERFIGEEVEVYAGVKADGTYTLYESAEYYVALKGVESAYVKMDSAVTLSGVTINPNKLIEDSRCPVGLMCIQAGTVRIETAVSNGQNSQSTVFELGETKDLFGKKLTFHSVSPDKEEGFSDSDYTFYFSVK